MRNKRLLLQALVAFAFAVSASCSRYESTPTPEPTPREPIEVDASVGETFQMKVGNTAHIGNGEITLDLIAAPFDRRCPPGASCTFVGRAILTLDARLENQPPETIQVELNQHRLPHVAALPGDAEIEIVRLDPSYVADPASSQSRYTVDFIVRKP